MKRISHIVGSTLAIMCALSACQDKTAKPPTPSLGTRSSEAGAPAVADAGTDRWLGQWNGPEGTFMKLAGGQGSYQITIRNLDGPRTFAGERVGDQIHFKRDGKEESIRTTTGAGTGMKWLDEKLNCLTISLGEGYCKD